jgi:hypothetical protein
MAETEDKKAEEPAKERLCVLGTSWCFACWPTGIRHFPRPSVNGRPACEGDHCMCPVGLMAAPTGAAADGVSFERFRGAKYQTRAARRAQEKNDLAFFKPGHKTQTYIAKQTDAGKKKTSKKERKAPAKKPSKKKTEEQKAVVVATTKDTKKRKRSDSFDAIALHLDHMHGIRRQRCIETSAVRQMQWFGDIFHSHHVDWEVEMVPDHTGQQDQKANLGKGSVRLAEGVAGYMVKQLVGYVDKGKVRVA